MKVFNFDCFKKDANQLFQYLQIELNFTDIDQILSYLIDYCF